MSTPSDIYRSATIKLTVWYVILVMAISLIFSGIVYVVARDDLAWGLRNQTARIYREYPVFSDNPFFVRDSDLALGSEHILWNLAYANLAVLVFAGVGSYWFAKRTLEPIEASNERQKQFVADASHELRTPLTALKMTTEVALMDESTDKKGLREVLESNFEDASRLETLINNLLRLSQLEAGDNAMDMAVLEVHDVAENALDNIATLAKTKSITVVNSVGTERVFGDPDSLKQLLVILLDNAIKYSAEKSEISVSSRSKAADTIITVRDHGQGIAPEALEHVFDRFYRADKARGANGYGLGLSIAKHIADLHYATIELRSIQGKGTKAIVTIPSGPSESQ